MQRLTIPVTLLIVLAAPPTDALAQGQAAIMTVDRLWGTPEFSPDRFGPAVWLADGSGYTTLEVDQRRTALEIVRYDPASGSRDVLVNAAMLSTPRLPRPILVEDYHWSADGSKLLLFTNSRRVWRDNTRGDFWVLDLQDGANDNRLRQLGGDFEATWLQFAKFSPQGDRVAYVYKNNVYVENLADGAIAPLTRDGSTTVINGTFDWVYEEEFHLQDGFRWSPDGTRIAYWQLDAEGVGEFYMIDNLSDLYSQIVPVQYPKVGTTNSACRVGVVSAAGGDTTWMQVEGDPRQNYMARMEWAASSDEVILQYLNRLQNTNRLLMGNATTGETVPILTETETAWLDVVDDLMWLEDGERFTWISEKDGWRHVYTVPRSGSPEKLVSLWDHEIVEIAHIDADGGYIYTIASPDDPTQRFLYRFPLSGGPSLRLTPDDAVGTHEYQISPDARWAIHTYSSFGVPPKIDLISLPDHRSTRMLLDNARLEATVNALAAGEWEFFRVDIGEGVELDGYFMKPPNFDASRSWPVIFHVYGEPWGQTVVDEWGSYDYLWHLMLAQQGYVVMSLDNRGTPAPRGRDWRKIVYGQIGILASEDQANGLLAIQQKWDWVDKTRIGIWGWSGGGSMTLNMLFRYPELYQTGASVAPVPDQLLYDTIYQERYMGLPDTNPDGFRDGSPINFAHQLQGNLLLVHGTADDNVHYQGTERLVDALITHDKQFSFMAYPNRSHSIFERDNSRRHLYKLMTNYFLDKLPAGAK